MLCQAWLGTPLLLLLVTVQFLVHVPTWDMHDGQTCIADAVCTCTTRWLQWTADMSLRITCMPPVHLVDPRITAHSLTGCLAQLLC
mgnify:CR=1 FL=1